jgi:uncharacterized protein YbjQ (UPF0145 family)
MLRTTLPENIQLTVLGQVEESKELYVSDFYGSTDEILRLMADKARKMGAEAVINVSTHQRIGFWAWARPVGAGTAVKFANKTDLNCTDLGGTLR